MVYDIFVSILAIIGIITVVVSSYKMVHGRVYPIGIVRRPVDSRKIVDAGMTEQQHFIGLTAKEARAKWPAKNPSTYNKKVWRCEKCGVVQVIEEDSHCISCMHVMTLPPGAEIAEADNLEAEKIENLMSDTVATLNREVKLHRRLFQDIEQRLRQLEVESAQKLQGEEVTQPAREELIH